MLFSVFSGRKTPAPKRKTSRESEKPVKTEERPLQAVLNQGYELMEMHGLSGWQIRFDHARRRAGLCDYNRKVISLSRHYARYAEARHIKDTLLHEIAMRWWGQDMAMMSFGGKKRERLAARRPDAIR